ncbi:MAG: hypothetical protein D8M59_01195 [Planctomycetes bacterium]|nr:hypothetical protein [Planctomycetota bacterium]
MPALQRALGSDSITRYLTADRQTELSTEAQRPGTVDPGPTEWAAGMIHPDRTPAGDRFTLPAGTARIARETRSNA